MPIYSAIDEALDLWCLVLTGKIRMPDVVGCLQVCLESADSFARVDALVDARRATGFEVAADEKMDEVVRLAGVLRRDNLYRTAYLTRTAAMRVNVDVLLQTVGSKRARRRSFSEIPEALGWLGQAPGSERHVAAFLAGLPEHQQPRRRWHGVGQQP